MTVPIVLSEACAFCVYTVSSSFVEWVFHRYAFHTPKVSPPMFRAHTMVHHQIYKGDDTYVTDDDHPESVPMNWWALPALLAVHLPFFLLIQYVTGIPSAIGGLLAVACYYGVYESIHWAMHVPRAAKFLGRFRAYRFLDAHHRVHHKYMLSNLNVVLPLADLTIGTLRRADGTRVPSLWKRTPAGTASPKPPLAAPATVASVARAARRQKRSVARTAGK